MSGSPMPIKGDLNMLSGLIFRVTQHFRPQVRMYT